MLKENLEKVVEAATDPKDATTKKSPQEKREAVSKWGRFPDLPDCRFLDNGRQIMLLKDFIYIRPDGFIMICPEGFISDGASIPKIVWPIADSPFTGKNLFPALIHDYYCFLGKSGNSPYDSSEVHYMFHQGLRAKGEPAWKARPKWISVKTFGPKFKAISSQHKHK